MSIKKASGGPWEDWLGERPRLCCAQRCYRESKPQPASTTPEPERVVGDPLEKTA